MVKGVCDTALCGNGYRNSRHRNHSVAHELAICQRHKTKYLLPTKPGPSHILLTPPGTPTSLMENVPPHLPQELKVRLFNNFHKFHGLLYRSSRRGPRSQAHHEFRQYASITKCRNPLSDPLFLSATTSTNEFCQVCSSRREFESVAHMGLCLRVHSKSNVRQPFAAW